MAAKPKITLTSFARLNGPNSGPEAAAQAEIDLGLIDIRKQVRSKIGDLTELIAAIKARGVDTPVLLLALDGGRFLLIAGERRYRAAEAAGLVKIPARIFVDLTPQQIRAVQVGENIDREDLSAYDEAMGVIADVEQYGMAGACEIWNRSESWVSKRVSVQKWAPAVRELLCDGLCGDLEVLGSLQQLRSASVDEFARFESRIRRGDVPGRNEVRDKVAQVKEWKRAQVEAVQKAAKAAELAPVDKAEKVRRPTAEPEPQGDSSARSATPPKPSLRLTAAGGQVKDDAEPEVGAESPAVEARAMAAEFAQIGTTGGKQLASLVDAVGQAGGDMAEADWLLWSAFVQVAAPLMQPLGKRGGAFLRKLDRELKAKTPEDLWREVQPAGEDGAIGGRLRPKDWHL